MPFDKEALRSSLVLIEAYETVDGTIRPIYWWWCPGCATRRAQGGAHLFHIPPWTFDNDDMERPTFSASYLVYPGEPIEVFPRCHSFVKDGRIQFLSDSTHNLAGQTMPMAPVPAWLRHGR